jgi:hypothetical protein
LAVNSDHNILKYHFDELFERKKIICGFNDEILDIKYTNDGSHIAVATNSNNVRLNLIDEDEDDHHHIILTNNYISLPGQII